MLYIAATPIGNLEDITLRVLRILNEADFLLAEDTRKTGRLLKKYQIEKRAVSFYEHNERKRIEWVLQQLQEGKDGVLVSSAGTPTISDPGYRLIRECRKHGLPVTSLPGPSSVINALALTSLPHEKFIFLGYVPRKYGRRQKMFQKVKDSEVTAVFFESPFRVIKTLKHLQHAAGDIYIGIAREMTKKFEEFLELKIHEAISHFEENKPQGEFVLIVPAKKSKDSRSDR